PLCQVIFQLRNIPQQPLLLQEVVSQFLSTENATAKFDLNFSCTEQPEGLLCFWEYNTDLFAVETIQRLAHHFQSLLESILSDPRQPIHALSLLKPDERRQLLIDWTQTRTAYPHQQSIHQLFEAQVRQRPDAIAL